MGRKVERGKMVDGFSSVNVVKCLCEVAKVNCIGKFVCFELLFGSFDC